MTESKSRVSAESRASAESHSEEKGGFSPFFDMMMHNELMLWPYRSLSKALLRTHADLTGFMEVNRKLADDMREIIRREQDLVLQISEKVLRHVTSNGVEGEIKTGIPAVEMEEIYDSAVAGIRELGKAVADAQIRSIESLRTHARSAMGHVNGGESKPSQAA